MGYLICYKCNIYYEVTEEEAKEFKNCGECGSPLTYFENLEDCYSQKKKKSSKKRKKKRKKTYTEQKKEHYDGVIVVGFLIAILGVPLLFLFSAVSIFGFILIVIGLIVILGGYSSGTSWVKGDAGEKRMSEYLQQLPKSFHVFNDVKLPGSRGNIDHIVVGPTGIFVIETKNYSTSYIVQNDKWYYKTRYGPKLADHNPGKQVKSNAMRLRKFLIKRGIIDKNYWVNSIVALNKKVTIKGKLNGYKIMKFGNIPWFIKYPKKYAHELSKDAIEKAAVFIDEFATQKI